MEQKYKRKGKISFSAHILIVLERVLRTLVSVKVYNF